MNRPQGVTILAWLAIIGGVFGIFASVFVVLAGIIAIGAGAAAGIAGGLNEGGAAAGAGVIAILAAVWLLLLSVVEIIFGTGALGLKPWAWTMGIWWCYISAVSNVISLFSKQFFSALIGLVIAIAILYYLFRDDVKAAFGKMASQPPSFLMPVFDMMDGWFNKGAAQPTAGYAPPAAPPAAPYAPPAPPAAPQPPADYAPPAAPAAPPAYAPPAPPVAPPAAPAEPAAPAAPDAPTEGQPPA